MKVQITILIIFIVHLFGQQTLAQNTISGLVKDKNGESLPGVTVVEKGVADNGTQTDLKGQFSLTLTKSESTLTFSYIGFTKKEVNVNGQKNIEIILNEDISSLDEVIVTGYGTQKRGNLTGSIATVSAEKLQDVTSPNIGNMLQGKVAGVDIVTNTGKPGAQPNINIRGRSSINSSVTPIWVVDGVIWHGVPNLNPQDVESISVLKDASAAALYGSRGANGVIVVTTKSASGDGTSIFNVSAKAGVAKFNTGKLKLADSKQLYNNWLEFANQNTLPDYFNESLLSTNTNWLDIGSQDGVTQDYNLTYMGVKGKSKIMATANYFNEDGTVKGFNYERFSSRMNVEYEITDKITLKPKVSANFTKTKDQQHSIYDMYRNMPWDNPYDANGNLVNPLEPGSTWYGRYVRNYLYDLQWNYTDISTFDILGDVDLQYNITDNLVFTSTNNITFYNSENLSYEDPRSTSGSPDNGRISNSMAKRTTRFTNQMLTYTNQIGKNYVKVLAAYEYSDYVYNNMQGTGKGIVPGAGILGSTSEPVFLGGTKNDYAFQSVLLNTNYGYDDRYNLQFSFRRDGASRFGRNHKYGNFFAISGSWNIHEESFFNVDKVDYLRVKAAYGGVGNTPESLYPQYELYSLNAQYNGQPGAIPSALGNDDLTWEKTYSTNIGLEFGLFGRLDGTFEFYNKNTSGLLHFVPLPYVSGFDGYYDNIGAVKNQGIELSLGGDLLKTPEFNWHLDFNIGKNKNEITELYAGKKQIADNKIIEVGQDIDTWYMRKWTGVNPENGDPQWELINADGTVTNSPNYSAAALQRVGTSTPDFFGGLSSSMTYKGFYLNANLAFSKGSMVYNAARELFDADGAYPTFNQMLLADGWSRWSPENRNATHPLPVYGGNQNSNKPSSRFIEDASFMRLRNITLGHRLNDRISNLLKMKAVSVYVSADNVFTITDFSGLDPEAAVNGDLSSPYPVPRRFTFGLNFSL